MEIILLLSGLYLLFVLINLALFRLQHHYKESLSRSNFTLWDNGIHFTSIFSVVTTIVLLGVGIVWLVGNKSSFIFKKIDDGILRVGRNLAIKSRKDIKSIPDDYEYSLDLYAEDE